MSDRPFTHANAGKEVRIEQRGREVCLIFSCGSMSMADRLRADILNQLKSGALNLTLMGKPTSVTEERP